MSHDAESHELLLLGLLTWESMHGYRLHEFLEHRLHFVSNLKRATAYRLLETLRQRGLVDGDVEREGRRPERLVYRLTPNGRKRFEALLRAQLSQPQSAVDPGNVALLFLDALPPTEQLSGLAERRRRLEDERTSLDALIQAHPASSPARLVLERALIHHDAELHWLDRAMATLGETVR